MKYLLILLALCGISLNGRDYAATVVDEANQPLPDVSMLALFSRMNDPRDASIRTFVGKTDAQGVFRFKADDDMCLIRLRASLPGHYDADLGELHGLGKVPSEPAYTLTLPRQVAGIPLCYKEVSLRRADGRLPTKTWVGFDLALGDVVRPWGKGEIADISFWNEGERIGWTQSERTIERYRHDKDHARFSEEEFDALYGSFRGVTRLRCEGPGNGILCSPSFWPYCLLKMPATAPLEGYATQLELPYATLPLPDTRDDFVGYFIRVRTKVGPDGKVISAHYAKIQRAVRHDFGVITFRYYYNPVPDNRRLAHDMKTNLLRPAPGTPGPDLDRYRSYEP